MNYYCIIYSLVLFKPEEQEKKLLDILFDVDSQSTVQSLNWTAAILDGLLEIVSQLIGATKLIKLLMITITSMPQQCEYNFTYHCFTKEK